MMGSDAIAVTETGSGAEGSWRSIPCDDLTQ